MFGNEDFGRDAVFPMCLRFEDCQGVLLLPAWASNQSADLPVFLLKVSTVTLYIASLKCSYLSDGEHGKDFSRAVANFLTFPWLASCAGSRVTTGTVHSH